MLCLSIHVTLRTVSLGLVLDFPSWVEVMWTFQRPLHHCSWAAPNWLHVLSEKQAAVWDSCHTAQAHIRKHVITLLVICRVVISARCDISSIKATSPPSEVTAIQDFFVYIHKIDFEILYPLHTDSLAFFMVSLNQIKDCSFVCITQKNNVLFRVFVVVG